jgi:hypothetical protein
LKLYTICVQGAPVLTMSVDSDPPMEDFVLRDPELLKAYRQSQALIEQIRREPGVDAIAEEMELHQALDTWLGEDLRALRRADASAPVWDGDPDKVRFREARTDEAERWHLSRRLAIEVGELDAGDEDWLHYLVPVKEPANDGQAPSARYSPSGRRR